jgi:hypothetical protein
LDTLHNGDYETIIAEAVLARPMAAGTVLGNFYLNYEDISGRAFREGPYPIILNTEPGGLIADARVREAEGYIAVARGLIDIGTRANGISRTQQDFNRLRNERATALRNSTETETVVITDSPEMAVMRNEIVGNLNYCLGLINSLSTHLTAISASLDNNRYVSELRILSNYRTSFTTSLESYTREE